MSNARSINNSLPSITNPETSINYMPNTYANESHLQALACCSAIPNTYIRIIDEDSCPSSLLTKSIYVYTTTDKAPLSIDKYLLPEIYGTNTINIKNMKKSTPSDCKPKIDLNRIDFDMNLKAIRQYNPTTKNKISRSDRASLSAPGDQSKQNLNNSLFRLFSKPVNKIEENNIDEDFVMIEASDCKSDNKFNP